MKKFKYLYVSALMAGVLALNSCDPADDRVTFQGPYYTQFTSSSMSISENSDGQANVEVSNVGPTLNQDIVVNYSIDPSSTAVEGVDYEIVGTPGQITIPSGQHFGTIGIKPIDNFATESDRILVLNLGSNNAGLNDGRGAIGVQTTVTIIDNDCPFDIEGDFSTTLTNTNPAGAEGLASEVTVEKVSDNPDGSITFWVSDITAGLYPDGYGSLPNPAEFEVYGLEILLLNQPDVVYGNDVFNGTGKIECDGSFTISWSNGYGDAGTTTHIPK